MKKLTKSQQTLFAKYVRVIDEIKSHSMENMESGNFNAFLSYQSMGMSQLEGVQKLTIWTLENDNLIQHIVDYAHQAWKQLLNKKYIEKDGATNA